MRKEFGGHDEKRPEKANEDLMATKPGPLRRARVLRHDRRPRAQEDLPRAVQHGEARHLDIPVIGVASSQWAMEELRDRARDGIEQFGGGVDDEPRSASSRTLLPYVDGDYADTKTFKNLRQTLGDAKHPAHYLAIPPSLFLTVVEGLGSSDARRTRA